MLSGVQVYDIAAALHDGTLYVVAVTEDRGADGLKVLVLLRGAPGSVHTELQIPVNGTNPTLEASGGSIHVDDERLFRGLSMQDTATSSPVDDVGWMFLGFAP